MEAGGPDRPEVEVLDTGRTPGAFRQWVTAVMQRRLVRAVVAVGVALVLVVAWATLPRDEPSAVAEADEATAADTSPGLRPPPARGREAPAGSWQLADDLAIRSGPRGHTVTFTATNRGAVAADPRELEVTGDFVDRPGLTYRATCSGVEHTERGFRTVRGTVGPRKTVLVRCTDTTRYGGRTAWIDPSTVTVRKIPCESEGSSPPM